MVDSEKTRLHHYCWRCDRPADREQVRCPSCGAERSRAGWPEDQLVGAVVGGKYLLLERLGAGGFGVVYLAEHVQFGALRAVKVLHHHFAYDHQIVERFKREARAIYRLTAPNIVRLEEFGEVREGVPFMAMEYAEGEALATVLAREGRLELRRALRIGRQIALALVDAAEHGILHRDLKPDNIRVNRHQRRGEEVKVLDFGISKILDEHTSSLTGQSILGTPEYMAPEIWEKADDSDHRADLFSLGVVFFQMLAGKLPWTQREGEPLTVFAQMQQGPAPLIGQAVPEPAVPPAVEQLVASLLSWDPSQRPQDAAAVVEAIDALGLLRTGSLGATAAPASTTHTTEPTRREFSDALLPTLPDIRVQTPARDDIAPPEARSGEGDTRNTLRRLIVAIAAIVVLVGGGMVILSIALRDDDSRDLPGDTGPSPDGTTADAGPIESPDTSDVAALTDELLQMYPKMVGIPGSTFRVGQSEEDGQGQREELGEAAGEITFLSTREVSVDSFLIDRFEISVAEYLPFQRRFGQDPQLLDWFASLCPGTTIVPVPTGNPQEPARNVSYHEAALFCEEQGKRLPTFEEWERAARGNHEGRYPWEGGGLVVGAYNSGSSSQAVYSETPSVMDGFTEVAPVTALATGASEWGVEGLAGNVAEWVSGPAAGPSEPPFFFRGGSYLTHALFLQVFAYQLIGDPCMQLPDVGFRCAVSAAPQRGD